MRTKCNRSKWVPNPRLVRVVQEVDVKERSSVIVWGALLSLAGPHLSGLLQFSDEERMEQPTAVLDSREAILGQHRNSFRTR